MKLVPIVFILLAPVFWLVYLTIQPEADLSVSIPIFHFYLVTFITFAAAVISILLTATLGLGAQPRHVLASTAFAAVGSIFFSHGVATPGALIDHFHPAVAWSAWLALFGGGLLFAAASLDGPGETPKWLPVRPIVYISIIAVLAYSAVATFAPGILTSIDEAAAPLAWHREIIFFVTLLLWAFAAFRLWQTWRVTQSRVDGALACVAFWLVIATVSMYRFPLWHLSWWLYHMILLVAFVVTVILLVIEYEHLRHFHLSRYFLAVALIVTAVMTLTASALFSQFSYDTLVAEVEDTSSRIAASVGNGLARDLPGATTPETLEGILRNIDISQLLQPHIQDLPIKDVYLYSTNGVLLYPIRYNTTVSIPADEEEFSETLRGETIGEIHAPDGTQSSYAPDSGVHIVEMYVPLRAGGQPDGQVIGVLVTIQEAPSLDQALINARVTGLLIGALTMGLLFLALLSVVMRADRIITVRTEDLRRVTAQLKTYSEWLLGADLLGRVLSDPDALSLVRRERTVMFIDIRNFTGWSEQRTPEEVVAMLNRYYNVAETIAKQHNAIRLKFAADEVMAIFPDAQRAVNTAISLRAELTRMLNEYNLGAGIGLNTGRLVEGLLGSREVKSYDVIGDTVNTAKHIENAASKTEALISETTLLALGNDVAVGPARQIGAKGKGAPVTVYPLLAE